MNAHLFTHWTEKGTVACTCGWSRRAKHGAVAKQLHDKHVQKSGRAEGFEVLRAPRGRFITWNVEES